MGKWDFLVKNIFYSLLDLMCFFSFFILYRVYFKGKISTFVSLRRHGAGPVPVKWNLRGDPKGELTDDSDFFFVSV